MEVANQETMFEVMEKHSKELQDMGKFCSILCYSQLLSIFQKKTKVTFKFVVKRLE